MDPVTLASVVTSILAPALTTFGENFAEDAGKKLWDTITRKFQDRPAAAGAASEFAEKADNPDYQEAFALQLKMALKEDSDFVNEVAQLVNRLQSSTGDVSNVGDGSVATEGGIATGDIQTGDVVGNIVIGNKNIGSQTSIGESKKASRQKKSKDKS